MSWFGKLFGTDEATKEVIGAVKDGVDALWYTDEEKAQDYAAAKVEGHKFIIDWLKSTTGSRVARRVIALTVTGLWTTQFVIAQILSVVLIWVDDPKPYDASVVAIQSNMDQTTGAMMLVLGFYFAAPHMGELAKAALVKFGGGKKNE